MGHRDPPDPGWPETPADLTTNPWSDGYLATLGEDPGRAIYSHLRGTRYAKTQASHWRSAAAALSLSAPSTGIPPPLSPPATWEEFENVLSHALVLTSTRSNDANAELIRAVMGGLAILGGNPPRARARVRSKALFEASLQATTDGPKQDAPERAIAIDMATVTAAARRTMNDPTASYGEKRQVAIAITALSTAGVRGESIAALRAHGWFYTRRDSPTVLRPLPMGTAVDESLDVLHIPQEGPDKSARLRKKAAPTTFRIPMLEGPREKCAARVLIWFRNEPDVKARLEASGVDRLFLSATPGRGGGTYHAIKGNTVCGDASRFFTAATGIATTFRLARKEATRLNLEDRGLSVADTTTLMGWKNESTMMSNYNTAAASRVAAAHRVRSADTASTSGNGCGPRSAPSPPATPTGGKTTRGKRSAPIGGFKESVDTPKRARGGTS